MNPPKMTSFTCACSPPKFQSLHSLQWEIVNLFRWNVPSRFFLLPLTQRLELQFPFHCLKSSALTSQFWLKCIFKLFMLITIFKMAALDNNDQNSSWFCSFCSWTQAFVPGIKGEKNSTGGTSINGYHALKWLSSPTWMLFLHYQEQCFLGDEVNWNLDYFFSLQWIAFLPSIFSCSLGTILFKQKKKNTLSSLCPRRFSGGWLEVTIVSYQNLVICLTNLTEFVNRSKYRLLSHKSIVFHLHWTEYNIVCHLLSF